MKKYLLVCFVLIAGLTAAAAQETGTPDPALIGVDTAQQMLQEISLSKFEDAGMWEASMPHDFGIAQVRKFLGQPQEKTPIEAEVQANINEADDYVLGVKTLYFRRALEYLTITPSRPIPIEGICKTISLWVIGRNYEHTLKILLRDYYGNYAELTIGKLNFSGWKRLTVAIPPTLVQKDLHYTNNMGIQIEGFRIDFDLKDTMGAYFVYFDDLRAVTDLFSENNRDPDDIIDAW